MSAVAIIKENGINIVFAVGGGSEIDEVKCIVAEACFENGDPWTIVSTEAKVEKALPFGTVLTLPATGSEMNSGSVITRAETQDKRAFNSSMVFPKFSVIDPTAIYRLPAKQTGNGAVDDLVHVMEQ